MSDDKIFKLTGAELGSGNELGISPVDASQEKVYSVDLTQPQGSATITFHGSVQIIARRRPHMLMRAKIPPYTEAQMAELKTWLEGIGGYIDGEDIVFPVELKLDK